MTNTYHAQTAKFLAKVAENMPAIPADIMQGWIENPKALQKALTSVLLPSNQEAIQLFIVPADLAFEERITRGNYSWRNSDLTEKKFPITADQIGEWEWKLFRFDRDISSEEAIRLMKEDGFEPGQIGHILTFGEKYPEEQRKFPIIGLGSVAEVRLNRRVPGLWHGRGRRGLNLHWFDGGWGRRYRFLGVRRRSVA